MPVIMLSGGFAAPDSVANISGWWRADMGVYEDAGTDPAEDADAVWQWNSQVGGWNFLQAVGGSQPTYKTGIVNGHPVVRFDGANDYMDSAMTVDNAMSNAAGTIFTVAYVYTITTNAAAVYDNDALWCDHVGGASPRIGQHLRSATPWSRAYNYDGDFDDATKAVDPQTAWKVFTWMHSGGNLYVGVLDTRTASLGSVASGNTGSVTGTFRMGCNYNTTVFTQVDIAELVMYDAALSESDRQIVERYLAWKYGLTLPY